MGYVIYIVIIIAGAIGWGMNIYKLANECDFNAPYKCEVIRGVSTVVPIIGAVTGYIDIEDGEK